MNYVVKGFQEMVNNGIPVIGSVLSVKGKKYYATFIETTDGEITEIIYFKTLALFRKPDFVVA